ncbi:hypothetical protein GW17_00056124 [Ensete ventricosum]|nr:hypothetical protein GW17_00056124 [Ensete ventricosum]
MGSCARLGCTIRVLCKIRRAAADGCCQSGTLQRRVGGWSPEDSTESAATQRRRGASGVALVVLQEGSAGGKDGWAAIERHCWEGTQSSRHRSDAAGGVESSNVGPSNWQRHGYDWEVAAGSLLGGRAEHREKKRDAGQGELLSFESENEFVVPSQ